MPTRNDDLRTYFTWIQKAIAQNQIETEKHLSITVDYPVFSFAASKTLLEALGYENTQVHREYPIKGLANQKVFADFRVGSEPHFWILELKKPSDNIDSPRFAEQVQDYMKGADESIPLGILFNGNEARAFINPKHRAFKAKVYQDYSRIVVKKASGINQLGELFAELAVNGALPDTAMVARKFFQHYRRADSKNKEARKAAVQKAIGEIVSCPSVDVASAIIGSVPRLKELAVGPEELLSVWATFQDKASAGANRQEEPK